MTFYAPCYRETEGKFLLHTQYNYDYNLNACMDCSTDKVYNRKRKQMQYNYYHTLTQIKIIQTTRSYNNLQNLIMVRLLINYENNEIKLFF